MNPNDLPGAYAWMGAMAMHDVTTDELIDQAPKSLPSSIANPAALREVGRNLRRLAHVVDRLAEAGDSDA